MPPFQIFTKNFFFQLLIIPIFEKILFCILPNKEKKIYSFWSFPGQKMYFHSFQMDSFADFFFFISIFLFEKNGDKKERNEIPFFLSAFFACLLRCSEASKQKMQRGRK
jgi:glycerol uptake facilitator-like aquaporin